MKQIILSLFFLILGIQVFSQVKINPEDLEHLNKRIIKAFKKSECGKRSNKVEIINVIVCEYNGPARKEIFLNRSFLHYVKPSLDKNRNLKSFSYIHSNNEIVACMEFYTPGYVFCVDRYAKSYTESNQYFIDKIKELDIKFSFSFHFSYICVSDSNIYIYTNEKFSLLNEYIENNWENFSFPIKFSDSIEAQHTGKRDK